MRLREFIQHNFWLKIFAVLMAALTWFTIRYVLPKEGGWVPNSLSRLAIVDFNHLRVSALTDPNDTRTYRIQPAEVTVITRGKVGDYGKLSARDIAVFVNLVGIGDVRELVREIKVICPPGIAFLDVKPTLVTVTTTLTNAAEEPHNTP